MIRALLKSARPTFSLVLTWPYLLTVYYARNGSLSLQSDLLSAAALALVLTGAYLLNDVVDVPVDRLKPNPRPLARGELPRFIAIAAVVVLLLAGITLAAIYATPAFAVTLGGVAAALVVYDLISKRIGTWKEWFVAALMTSIYPLAAAQAGGFTGPRGETLPLFACWMFLSSAAYEIFSDLADRKVDRATGGGPAALQRQPLKWLRIGDGLLVLGGLTLAIPVFMGTGPLYRLTMVPLAAIAIALAVRSKRPVRKMRRIYLEFVLVGVITTLDVLLFP